jgi:hypothetical protein
MVRKFLAHETPKEQLEDLVCFVATEEYAQLRRTLGVRVG